MLIKKTVYKRIELNLTPDAPKLLQHLSRQEQNNNEIWDQRGAQKTEKVGEDADKPDGLRGEPEKHRIFPGKRRRRRLQLGQQQNLDHRQQQGV